MSNRRDSHLTSTRQSEGLRGAPRRDTRTVSGLLRPTWRELLTIWSAPALLFLVHFVLQPSFEGWRRLGYVRYTVAQSAPAHRIAPEPLTPYAWAWHELTRVSHALIHAPGAYHVHVLGNVALIVVTSWTLLVVLSALGQRHRFVFFYWELVVVAPIVGSFAFDLFGRTASGYGASTVGFAFLGVVAVVSVLALVNELRRRMTSRFGSNRSLRVDGGYALSPIVMVGFFLFVVAIVVGDVVTGSPAMPVHQAGVGFGALVGAVVVPLSR